VDTLDLTLPLASTTATAPRGFVYVDLRGHARYLASRGPDAGDELLARYRSLVGSTLRRHAATGFPTEGDGIYAVLRSPAAAVRCARAVIEATRRPADRGAPIAVGIGVHAAPASDDELAPLDGPGHLAARLGGLASAGEILVTEPVRHHAGSTAFQYVERGIQRMKGIVDPVTVYAVEVGGSANGKAGGTGRVARLLAASALVGMLGLVIAVGIGGTRPGVVGDPAAGGTDDPGVVVGTGPAGAGPAGTSGTGPAPTDGAIGGSDPGVVGLEPPGVVGVPPIDGVPGPDASPSPSPGHEPEPRGTGPLLDGGP
jgi:class 3 adenylate cyclase